MLMPMMMPTMSMMVLVGMQPAVSRAAVFAVTGRELNSRLQLAF